MAEEVREEACDKCKELMEENRKLKDQVLDLLEKIDSYEWAMGI